MAKTARILLYCLLIWAPLPLGSNRPIFWVINGITASLILGLFVAGELTSEHRVQIDWRPAAWALFALAIWVIWMVVQALPGLPAAFQHPLWATLRESIPGASGAISISPSATWTTLAQVGPIVFLSVVAMRLAVNKNRAEFLLKLIVAATTGVAAYGLVALYAGFEQVVLLDAVAYEGFLTGTFVGRNAVATYFVIGLAVASSLAATRIEAQFVRQHRAQFRLLNLAEAVRAAGPYFAACAILTVALLNTGSRGGTISGAIALACVALFWVWRALKDGRSIGLLFAAMIAVLFVIATVSSDLLVHRLETEFGSEVRLLLYRDTLDMIRARPLLGHGAGTFADAYPLFHIRAPAALVWNRAHNSFLQAAAELGIPVLVIILTSAGGVLIYIVRRIAQGAGPATVAVAAVSAAIAVAFHSLVDFSIQIQAVGLTLAVLIGAGLGAVAAMPHHKTKAFDRGTEVGSRAASSASRYQTIHVTIPSDVSGGENGADDRPAIPEGQRIYVFGDLHGRLDLLARLRKAIERDSESLPGAQTTLIGLGDYVDRGPRSDAVVEALATGFLGPETIFLRGNHEQMLLDFLEEPARFGPDWFRYGALETLSSYNVPRPSAGTTIDYRAIRHQLAARIPPWHILFYQRLPMSHQIGDYFFAHAGARPGTPLEYQAARDLLWIREGFADRDEVFEKVVVHGHTPVDQPYFGEYRINLDTGAYVTDRLT